jgi:putative endonuclease
MMATKRNALVYVGMSSVLVGRVWQHKNKIYDGFTKKFNCNKLVWYESYQYVYDAIRREREIKKWRREKKNALVEAHNPEWEDLAAPWFEM